LLFIGSDKDNDFDVVVYVVVDGSKDFLLFKSQPRSGPDTFFNSEMLSAFFKNEEVFIPDELFDGIGGVEDL